MRGVKIHDSPCGGSTDHNTFSVSLAAAVFEGLSGGFPCRRIVERSTALTRSAGTANARPCFHAKKMQRIRMYCALRVNGPSGTWIAAEPHEKYILFLRAKPRVRRLTFKRIVVS
jgi:hypothetical protein